MLVGTLPFPVNQPRGPIESNNKNASADLRKQLIKDMKQGLCAKHMYAMLKCSSGKFTDSTFKLEEKWAIKGIKSNKLVRFGSHADCGGIQYSMVSNKLKEPSPQEAILKYTFMVVRILQENET